MDQGDKWMEEELESSPPSIRLEIRFAWPIAMSSQRACVRARPLSHPTTSLARVHQIVNQCDGLTRKAQKCFLLIPSFDSCSVIGFPKTITSTSDAFHETEDGDTMEDEVMDNNIADKPLITIDEHDDEQDQIFKDGSVPPPKQHDDGLQVRKALTRGTPARGLQVSAIVEPAEMTIVMDHGRKQLCVWDGVVFSFYWLTLGVGERQSREEYLPIVEKVTK